MSDPIPADRYLFDEAETRRRMACGELYALHGDGLDALAEERDACKARVERFNATPNADKAARRAISEEMLGAFGEGSWLETPVYLDYGTNTFIGEGTWINTGFTVVDDAPVRIGSRVLIGPHVTISTAGHPVHPALRITSAQFSAPVTIEDEAWVGAHVVLLPGVTVGRGSVVAAGAVVAKDVPPMCVVGGVPARILRRITDEDLDRGFAQPGSLT